MLISIILISIATIGGLLSLWRDEFIHEKIIIEESDTEQQKTEKLQSQLKRERSVKIKSFSTLFILLTLAFTLFQIHQTHKSALSATKEKIAQRIQDSTRYATDSLANVIEREEDRLARKVIDSIYTIQLNALRAQLLAGKTVESIKKKTTVLLEDLKAVDTTIKYNTLLLTENAEYAIQSFKELNVISKSTRRQLYLLDDDIKMKFSFGLWNKQAEQKIDSFISLHKLKGNYIEVDSEFPFYAELNHLLEDITIDLKFYHPVRKAPAEYLYIPNELMLVLQNKHPLRFVTHNQREYWNLPENYFRINYHKPSKSFFFSSNEITLAITTRRDNYFSILDYNNAILLLQIETPMTLENQNSFFNMDSSYINFEINFSNKKNSKYYRFIERKRFSGQDYWAKFLVDSVKFVD